MKDLKQHILEKLKVSKNSIYDITLEAFIDALKDYKERKGLFYATYIDFRKIFKQNPTVLQYNGTYTNRNIIGNEIHSIRYIYDQVSKTDAVYIYFDTSMLTDSIQIENTKELYDIFGEEALHKIYDYIVNH